MSELLAFAADHPVATFFYLVVVGWAVHGFHPLQLVAFAYSKRTCAGALDETDEEEE